MCVLYVHMCMQGAWHRNEAGGVRSQMQIGTALGRQCILAHPMDSSHFCVWGLAGGPGSLGTHAIPVGVQGRPYLHELPMSSGLCKRPKADGGGWEEAASRSCDTMSLKHFLVKALTGFCCSSLKGACLTWPRAEGQSLRGHCLAHLVAYKSLQGR